MTTHELARLLLKIPDRPVAVSVHGYVYSSQRDRMTHGPIQVGESTIGTDTTHTVIGCSLPWTAKVHRIDMTMIYRDGGSSTPESMYGYHREDL